MSRRRRRRTASRWKRGRKPRVTRRAVRAGLEVLLRELLAERRPA